MVFGVIVTESLVLSSQASTDNQSLNLVGALEYLHDLRLAHVPLYPVVPRVSGTTEDLHGISGDLHRCVCRNKLGYCGSPGIGQPDIASSRGI